MLKSLTGNWREEVALEEAKADRFRQRTLDGTGNWKKLQTKMAMCEEKVPLSYSEDGLIRFGDSIVLQHIASSEVLACDPFEELMADKFCVSGVSYDPSSNPQARTTFTIVRPPEKLNNFTDNFFNDDVVRIGQAFLLRASESLVANQNSEFMGSYLYLSSTKLNERTATAVTNKQMVFVSPECRADAVWTAIIPSQGRKNGTLRALKHGEPIQIDEVYQLTHRQTNMFITLDRTYMTRTEFGVESQCYADRSNACAKLGLMESESKGFSTSSTLAKPDPPTFSWKFTTASDPSLAVDERNLPKPATHEILLAQMRQDLENAGDIESFKKHFKNLELALVVPGRLDIAAFKVGLEEYLSGHQTLPEQLFDIVVDMADSKGLGVVDYEEFLKLLY